MEKRGLVLRGRSAADRRVVIAHLTKKGHELVNALDEPIAQTHVAQLSHMKTKDLKALIDLLEDVREERAED